MAGCYSRGGAVKGATKHSGKGSQEQTLPHRMAMTQLTKGDPMQRTMNNYAKKTPGIDNESPSLLGMGSMGGGAI
jgi:hypothetical protein